MDMKKCYHLISGAHAKFWTVEVIGSNYLATFGRIGSRGLTQIKTFAFPRGALNMAEKMIKEKVGKGYQEADKDRYPSAAEDLVASLSGGAARTGSSPRGVLTYPEETTRNLDI